MPRVLVINAYPLDWRLQEVREGLRPDQELYGVNHFAEGDYEVELMPQEQRRVLRTVSAALRHRRFPLPVGDLWQQLAAWRRAADGADLIYAASQSEAHALGYLRAAGLLKIPLVVVAHHPPAYYRGSALQAPLLRWSLRGCDAVPCLNTATARAVNTLAPRTPHPRAKTLPWGPDARFFTPAGTLGDLFVSAGQAGRDFATFAAAAAAAGVPGHIVTLTTAVPQGVAGGGVRPGISEYAPGVKLDLRRPDDWMTHVELRSLYRRARAVAIPLERTSYLAGLTSLMDALAMGLPVVMTRTPFIDIDLEAQGIGMWVDAGDAHGWRAALEKLRDDPDEAAVMGARGRALVDGGLDSRHFADEIMAVFDRLLGRRP